MVPHGSPEASGLPGRLFPHAQLPSGDRPRLPPLPSPRLGAHPGQPRHLRRSVGCRLRAPRRSPRHDRRCPPLRPRGTVRTDRAGKGHPFGLASGAPRPLPVRTGQRTECPAGRGRPGREDAPVPGVGRGAHDQPHAPAEGRARACGRHRLRSPGRSTPGGGPTHRPLSEPGRFHRGSLAGRRSIRRPDARRILTGGARPQARLHGERLSPGGIRGASRGPGPRQPGRAAAAVVEEGSRGAPFRGGRDHRGADAAVFLALGARTPRAHPDERDVAPRHPDHGRTEGCPHERSGTRARRAPDTGDLWDTGGSRARDHRFRGDGPRILCRCRRVVRLHRRR